MTIKEQTDNGEAPVSPFRRLAIEAGPLVVFFVANSAYDIMIGTAAFMVATAISLAVSLKVERRVPLMPLVSSLFVLLFGGLTLALDDEIFIKLKPTVVNLFFASVLLAGLLAGRVFLKHTANLVADLLQLGVRVALAGHRHHDPEHVAELVVDLRTDRALGQTRRHSLHLAAQIVPDRPHVVELLPDVHHDDGDARL